MANHEPIDRPEAHYTDAGLVTYYEQALEALPKDDPGRAEAESNLRRARRAALFTDDLVAEANAEAQATIEGDKAT
jgi:hypothetical protein